MKNEKYITTNDNLSLHRVTGTNDEAFLCLKIYQHQYHLFIHASRMQAESIQPMQAESTQPMQAETHGIIATDVENALETS